MVKIAVEQPFTDVRRALKKRGYKADMVNQVTDAVGYDAIVVRNQNVFAGSRIEGSLIETRGRSVNEIVAEVEERLQRAGKIAGTADAEKSASGGGFTAGVLTGALVGAAAALLLAPKSGKEMQVMVKEKIPSGDSDGSGKLSQVKEKAAEVTSQAKEKATELTEQAKEKAAELKEKKDGNDSSGSQQKEKQDPPTTL